MSRALVVEDDKIQSQSLKNALTQFYPSMKVIEVHSSKDAIDVIANSVVNGELFSLFLLDIQLQVESSDRGGFHVAEYIRKQPCYYTTPLLFLTFIQNDIQIALNNFHCYNYITKPYSTEDVISQLEQMTLSGILREQCLSLTDTDNIHHRIMQKDILYIYCKSHVLSLTTTLGTVHTRKYTLKTLQEELSPDFMRCHNSYILNIRHVTSYDRLNRCAIINGKTVPISRPYLSQLEILLQYTK